MVDLRYNRQFMLILPSSAFEFGILAAISGGADSVAMLHLLAEALSPTGKLAVAHVNHALRAADSDADARFVQSLAQQYHLRYFECRLDAGSVLNENAARNMRYDFLVHQAEQLGFRYLATAHTADDQTETILHRILRGTGLAGLAGIAPVRSMTPAVTLLRPLLSVRRSEILAYLKSRVQDDDKNYRDDKTNFENRFTRNRIRNQLLPTLRKNFNPQVDEALCRLATLASENESVLSELLDTVIENAVIERTSDGIVLDVLSLQHYSLPVLREVLLRIWKQQKFPLREMGYSHWSSLAELFQVLDKRLDFPGGISVERTRNRLVVRKG